VTVFEPDYRPIPIFSGFWTVLVLVSVVINAARNDRPFTEMLVGDFWEIVLYVAMGVVASCAAPMTRSSWRGCRPASPVGGRWSSSRQFVRWATSTAPWPEAM
jgi:hypothetical protein